MLLQQPHGFTGIAAQRGADQRSMFTGHVAIFVVPNGSRPPAIQLGRIAKRQRHRAQPLIRAGGKQCCVKARVCQRPLFAHQHRVTVGLHRGAVERMVRRHELALPGDVAVLDRHPQHKTLELAARSCEILEIIVRERGDAKPVLRFGLDQTLLGQSRQPLAQHTGAAVVAVGQLGEAQPGAWQDAAGQDVGAELRVHLLTAGDGSQW